MDWFNLATSALLLALVLGMAWEIRRRDKTIRQLLVDADNLRSRLEQTTAIADYQMGELRRLESQRQFVGLAASNLQR